MPQSIREKRVKALMTAERNAAKNRELTERHAKGSAEHMAAERRVEIHEQMAENLREKLYG